jgi:5'-nucleotidase
MAIRILHTNDIHGSLGPRQLERLVELRDRVDLYFDTGDVIQTGNLGIPFKPDPAWALLEALRCTAGVLGNRETHVLDRAFMAKLQGAGHPLLCANLRKRDGSRPLPSSMEIEAGGYRVGLIGVMVPMVTERMKTSIASAFLWDAPIPRAADLARELRPRVDALFALTHIGHRQDLALAAAVPELDAIFGGHSHTVLPEPVRVGRTSVVQGGSHGRFAGVYEWTPESGLTGSLEPLR